MIILLTCILLLLLTITWYMNLPKFGSRASGSRMERIRQSPHFRNGQFQNIHFTPTLTEGVNFFSVLSEFFLSRRKRRIPAQALPAQKTDLLSLSPDTDILVWFGHSSYFMQVDGKKILVDPVFSGAASPLKFTTRSFKGTDIYIPGDFPGIDYLFLSHDHWDHLDYETLVSMKPKINRVITGLGTGAHLERWGFEKDRILELEWEQQVKLDDGFTVQAFPGRHFSGRGFKRNRFLWVSFALQTPKMKLYIGGDSGYDDHFTRIGDQYGPFDLAILECGQYDESWKYIHMLPEETVQATKDLRAARLLPVHWAKFALCNHDWDDPIIRVSAAAKTSNLPITTPMIGQAVNLHDFGESVEWWKNLP
ncbi:MAG TPA: MBL fold metallo-hydrolase [Puia sp.]|nr:MBL fold metallo-hydrolase [Puia sp.]